MESGSPFYFGYILIDVNILLEYFYRDFGNEKEEKRKKALKTNTYVTSVLDSIMQVYELKDYYAEMGLGDFYKPGSDLENFKILLFGPTPEEFPGCILVDTGSNHRVLFQKEQLLAKIESIPYLSKLKEENGRCFFFLLYFFFFF
jgi:hypothetical protein